MDGQGDRTPTTRPAPDAGTIIGVTSDDTGRERREQGRHGTRRAASDSAASDPAGDREGSGATIELSLDEIRAVAAFAVECAEPAASIFEQACPRDSRARDALDVTRAFAEGARRSKAIRDAAWAAWRAYQETRDAGLAAASEAARSAHTAASSAYLHPLSKATQVRHILGAAAHTAQACELDAGDNADVAAEQLRRAQRLATPAVIDVLRRYPTAPTGGARPGELIRTLDAVLRDTSCRGVDDDGARPRSGGTGT
ncbi:hypothetical protein LY12_003153 [Prauserella alba]|uniref:Imm-5-like domain-containing protein n=1 Tax=Prauserella alba TaxID=176898 RepID=A0ABP4G4L4_9PSEU|nr:hypothetical protein [Prauserella alba]